jgi:glycosyltransferase involved in cell wall biosynthesis
MISVIICTCDRDSSLRLTLDSLAQMAVPPDIPWELIVVDNNSRDRTRDLVEELTRSSRLDIRYVFEPRQGKSYALNTGIAEANGEIIALTDDDVIVDRQWLREVKKAFDEFDCLGVAGKVTPLWSFPKPPWLVETGPYALDWGPIVNFDLGENPCAVRGSPAGANLSFKRTVFDRYGFFRTDLGPSKGGLMRGEDTEFFVRLTRCGETILYAPKAVVYHPVERSRSRKGYYRGWCFQIGRFEARIQRIPRDSVRYFGVPTYLFRNLFEDVLRWIFTLQSKRRFYYELKVRRLAGRIFEMCLARRENQ